jgi:hypothetical protein
VDVVENQTVVRRVDIREALLVDPDIDGAGRTWCGASPGLVGHDDSRVASGLSQVGGVRAPRIA